MQVIIGQSGLRLRVALGASLIAAATCLAVAIGDHERADAATAQASATKTVSIDHFKFKPSSLSVGKGTRVVFSNLSKVKHNATVRGSFTTGKIKPGSAVAVKFTAKGIYRYLCTIHPEMRGTIIVG